MSSTLSQRTLSGLAGRVACASPVAAENNTRRNAVMIKRMAAVYRKSWLHRDDPRRAAAAAFDLERQRNERCAGRRDLVDVRHVLERGLVRAVEHLVCAEIL